MTCTTSIAADLTTVRTLINSLREWELWSPWQHLDPDMTQTYSGPDAGVGSAMEWSGNKKAGQGRMEIVGSTSDHVDIALSFLKPWKAENHVRIALQPNGTGTQVDWTMTGEQNVTTRMFFKVFRMEKYLAKDFDRGLAQLKAVAEARATA